MINVFLLKCLINLGIAGIILPLFKFSYVYQNIENIPVFTFPIFNSEIVKFILPVAALLLIAGFGFVRLSLRGNTKKLSNISRGATIFVCLFYLYSPFILLSELLFVLLITFILGQIMVLQKFIKSDLEVKTRIKVCFFFSLQIVLFMSFFIDNPFENLFFSMISYRVLVNGMA